MSKNIIVQIKLKNLLTIFIIVITFELMLFGCTDNKTKTYQVGIINVEDFFLPVVDGFKAKMTQLGYIEGKNIFYDLHRLNNNPAGERKAAQKMVDARIDLIVTVSTGATVQAKSVAQGTNIPIVFAYAGVEGCQIVDSMYEPGNNITGVRFPGPDQIAKRLEILLELAPSIKRIWIGYDKNYPNSIPALNALRQLTSSYNVTLVESPLTDVSELKLELAAREKMTELGFDAIILMPDRLNHSPDGWKEISSFATKHKIPIGGSFLYTVRDGAVFGNANDLYKVGEIVAPLADKIFQGIPTEKIPIVTPKQDVWINYTVARKLGLIVPNGLLSKADKIIR